MRLKNCNAIITGATGGFGRMITQTFFREGTDKIALIDINGKALGEFSKELKEKDLMLFLIK